MSCMVSHAFIKVDGVGIRHLQLVSQTRKERWIIALYASGPSASQGYKLPAWGRDDIPQDLPRPVRERAKEKLKGFSRDLEEWEQIPLKEAERLLGPEGAGLVNQELDKDQLLPHPFQAGGNLQSILGA